MIIFHPLYVLSIFTAVFLGGLATPHVPRWGGMRVMHAWNAVPQNWVSMGHPHTETTIDLHLALKSHHEHALTDVLYEISNPAHSRYGAYLSKEQVAELVAPHPDTLNLVNSWLKHYDVPSSSISMTLGGNWLAVINVPVSQADEMLGASYELYQHVETNDSVIRTMSYSLPDALHEHIKAVVPTTYFGSSLTMGMTRRMEAVDLASRDTEVSVTPSVLRSLYKTEGYIPAAADRNELGVTGYAGEFPSPQDFELFMEKYRTDEKDATYTVELVNGGGYDPSHPGEEANLDIQYAAGIAYPTPLNFYSTAGDANTESDPYIHWLAYVLNQKTIPQTISMSYGGDEHAVPSDYLERICYLFAQLGARGVSVIFSTGDWGVGQGDCRFYDSSDNIVELFKPVFPATCPFVTSVGGTQGGTTKDDPEVAASLSGGGFSLFFSRPPYQDNAVHTFLDNFGDKYSSYYNAGGRGFPDVSAQALEFIMFYEGALKDMHGTSCSTPTVAGIISLLNDHLISKGKPPLGFLNPWLYSKGLAGFNDITSGSNPGCGTDGFSAIVGWDPVTGLGTPDFIKLMKIIDDNGASSSNTKH
ncbi:peptidase S8/S53 domain-containing protein [Lactarius quietus]|nr:peptidase S8/S53 domain-containing protein [Lactarius quietus]